VPASLRKRTLHHSLYVFLRSLREFVSWGELTRRILRHYVVVQLDQIVKKSRQPCTCLVCLAKRRLPNATFRIRGDFYGTTADLAIPVDWPLSGNSHLVMNSMGTQKFVSLSRMLRLASHGVPIPYLSRPLGRNRSFSAVLFQKWVPAESLQASSHRSGFLDADTPESGAKRILLKTKATATSGSTS
jgi:hypothetical protein